MCFWSAAQWELFVKKRSYIDRKKPSCPSGYVPPAPLASPRTEIRTLGLLPLLFPALQVVRGRAGGSRDAPGIVSRWASSPPAGSQSSGWGGSASGLLSVVRTLASLAPSGAGVGGVAWSQRSFLARYAPRLSLTIPRCTLDDVGNCGRFRRTACYPLVVLDLRIVEHGRIRELVHGRVVVVDRGRLSRSRSFAVRGQRSRAVIVAVALCPCAVASLSVAVF